MPPAARARAHRRWLVAAALALPALPSSASASPSYAPALQDFFALAEAPPCGLCHANDEGSAGVVNLFVGRYLRDVLKLEANLDDESFKAIAFKWNRYQDSDGDTVCDGDELRGGSDPNDPNDVPGSPRAGSGGGGAGGAGGDDDDDDEGGSSGSNAGDDDSKAAGPAAGGCSYAGAAGPGRAGATAALAFALAFVARLTRRRGRGA